MTDEERIAIEIVRITEKQGGSLFYQLVNELSPMALGTGHIYLIDYPNVVLWTNVSDRFVQAFNLALPQLEMHRADPKMYAFFSDDLGFPALPVVSALDWRDKNLNYETKHWLPVVFFVAQTKNLNSDSRALEAAGGVSESSIRVDTVLHPAAA